jgi:hypothetical protein
LNDVNNKAKHRYLRDDDYHVLHQLQRRGFSLAEHHSNFLPSFLPSLNALSSFLLSFLPCSPFPFFSHVAAYRAVAMEANQDAESDGQTTPAAQKSTPNSPKNRLRKPRAKHASIEAVRPLL